MGYLTRLIHCLLLRSPAISYPPTMATIPASLARICRLTPCRQTNPPLPSTQKALRSPPQEIIYIPSCTSAIPQQAIISHAQRQALQATTRHHTIELPSRGMSPDFLRGSSSTNCSESTNATISGPLPLRCYWPACTYTGTFSKKGQLTRHVNTKHISPGSFECPQLGCGKAFDRKDNLGEHMRRIHLGRYSQALARSDYGS
jgi:uncharacterized Zn-finger protein